MVDCGGNCFRGVGVGVNYVLNRWMRQRSKGGFVHTLQ